MFFRTLLLPTPILFFALVLAAPLAGCGSAPPGSGDEALGVESDEGSLGGTVTELVPADDTVRVSCRAEVNRRHCGSAEADRAAKACAAKLPARHPCKTRPAACFTREAKNLSCQRSSESYPTLAACAVPLAQNCAFYAQCLDRAGACGETGYALGFGEKYCNGFRRTEFSEKGTAWVDSVMVCLQRALVPTVQNATNGFVNASLAPAAGSRCEATLDLAFASHPACYTHPEASICFLPPADLAKVFAVIGAREAFTSRTRAQIATTIGTCVGQLARTLVGIPLAAPGTNAPSAADDRVARASLPRLHRTREIEALLAQRDAWLGYAEEYGVAVP